MAGTWHATDWGLWCPGCGELIASADALERDLPEPDTCSACGFPEDTDIPVRIRRETRLMPIEESEVPF
ncbi:MAG: hypothetical protein VYD90_10395 [Pseudomonadota bacterium]|nr:hypothetical protein [Pseudomonadota bacterium]